MTDFAAFLDVISGEIPESKGWKETLARRIQDRWNPEHNKDLAQFQQILRDLPLIAPSVVDLNQPAIQIGSANDATSREIAQLRENLMALHPWRKGPFNLFGIFIDSEWRSDMKWKRLKDHIDPLKDRRVLDVGCGNGYHCLRMAGADARLVVGIDPYLKNVAQFAALQRYLKLSHVQVLPLAIEDLPGTFSGFDTVFSMGVLYHRRSPFDHLFRLKQLLRHQGQLVLETLVIEGEPNRVLVPQDRYAKMRNVWFIPTPGTLKAWLERAGFREIRLLDVSITTVEEQRPTAWMRFESLPHFLHPEDKRLTIEGYPRPRRALFLATRP